MTETSPRERMIRSAALLIRERGVENTSFSDVLAHSGAPRGSIYHYFPGGKAQLIEEATRWAGGFIVIAETAALEGDDPVAGVEAAVGFWRSVLSETNFAAGCPVVAATVEGDKMPAARDAAAEAFRQWVRPIAQTLERRGVARARAEALAALIISSIEGAVIIARAQRTMDPLDQVGDELRTIVRDAVEAA